MIDPRFEEVLEFIDERGDDGIPTVRAKLAIKIQAYSQDIADLRSVLATLEDEVVELQTSVDAQDVALHEQADRKVDLVTEAQDAAVRAAMSSGGGARLRKIAMVTRERIAEFEKDYEADSTRLEHAKLSLEAKSQGIKDQRDSIVRRLNTMSSLADRAGLEFGTELTAPKQTRQQAAPAARAVRRRAPRRVRVRRRRAS